jgi:hypothetical protein
MVDARGEQPTDLAAVTVRDRRAPRTDGRRRLRRLTRTSAEHEHSDRRQERDTEPAAEEASANHDHGTVAGSRVSGRETPTLGGH